VSTGGEVGAVVLVCTTRGSANIVRALDAIDGVSRVELVRGPYDLVIHAAGPAQVEIIERFPGVTATEVCWLCPRSQGGTG
jgi:hypothetical protein